MIYKKNQLILFLFLILIPVLTKAQSDISKKKIYSKGTIQLKNRQSFSGKKLVFDSDNLTFYDTRNLNEVVVPTKELQYVKAQTGTYAVEGGLLCGLLCGLGILEAYASAASNQSIEINKGRIPIVIGIGVLGGAAIGAIFKKEKIVFRDNKLVADIFIKNECPFFCNSQSITSVGIRFQFQNKE